MSRPQVKGKKRVVTEDDFNSIKKILELSKLNDTQIGKLVNRSGSTIGYIRRFENFEEYQKYMRTEKHKPKQQTSFQYVSNITEVPNDLVNAKLIKIENKLDFVIELLNKKRRIF